MSNFKLSNVKKQKTNLLLDSFINCINNLRSSIKINNKLNAKIKNISNNINRYEQTTNTNNSFLKTFYSYIGYFNKKFLKSNFPKAKFNKHSSTLTNVFLNGIYLEGADLNGMNLSNAYLKGIDFKGAKLINVNFSGANLKNVNLCGADLTGAKLTGVFSGGIKSDLKTKLPTNYAISLGHIIGPGVNLTKANLSNIEFYNIDLTGAILDGAYYTKIALYDPASCYRKRGSYPFKVGCYANDKSIPPKKYKFVKTDLGRTFLIGPNMNLSGVVGSNMDISNLDLSTCKLKRSFICANNTTNTLLPPNYTFVQNIFIFSIDNNDNIPQSALVGPYVYFSCIDSVGAFLQQADSLINVDLTGFRSNTNYFTMCPGPFFNAFLKYKTVENEYFQQFKDKYQTWKEGEDIVLRNKGINGPGLSGEYKNLPPGYKLIRKLFGTDPTYKFNIVAYYVLGPKCSSIYLDLSNCDIRNVDLRGSNFKGVISGGLIHDHTTLLSPNYIIIKGCLFGPGVNLSRMDISGLDLSKCDLTGVISGGTISDKHTKLPPKYRMVNTCILGPGVNLKYNRVKGAGLMYADLSNLDLSNADLTGVNLTGANLTNVKFHNTILNAANLTNAILTNVSGKITIFKCCKYQKSNPLQLPDGYTIINRYIVGLNVNLSNAILKNINFEINLGASNLSNAVLTGSQFFSQIDGCNLKRIITGNFKISPKPYYLPDGYFVINGYIMGPEVNLYKADLSTLDLGVYSRRILQNSLQNAILTKANLKGTNLSTIILSGVISGKIKWDQTTKLPEKYAIIKGYIVGPDVNLFEANLCNANLTTAILTGVTSGKIKSNCKTILPAKYRIVNGYLIGPQVNLSNAVLTGANLSNCNLYGANLTGVISGNITNYYHIILPEDYQIINGYIIGPNVNLFGANLFNTDLTIAILTDIESGEIKSNSNTKLPLNYYIVNGYLIGQQVNLSGANLTNANLSGKNLSNCNLTNAILIGANLTNCDLSNANLNGVISGKIKNYSHVILPEKYQIVNGYLIGPDVNLSGATFINAQLTGVDLINANLSYATFTNVNLSNSFLKYANLSYATLTNVDLTEAYLKNAVLSYANIQDSILPKNKLDNANMLCLRSKNITVDDGSNILMDEIPYKIVEGYIVGMAVDLSDADLSKGSFVGILGKFIKTNNKTIFPDNYIIKKYGTIVGPGVVLKYTETVDLNLSNLDLSNATISCFSSENMPYLVNSTLNGTTFEEFTGNFFCNYDTYLNG